MDPSLLPQDEYDALFVNNVFLKDPMISPYIQKIKYTEFSDEFIKKIDLHIASNRGKTAARDIDGIDLENPHAILINNYSSFKEGNNEEDVEIMQFETKPKSGTIEYVPSKVIEYIEQNKEQL